jgi:hypothetical protein
VPDKQYLIFVVDLRDQPESVSGDVENRVDFLPDRQPIGVRIDPSYFLQTPPSRGFCNSVPGIQDNAYPSSVPLYGLQQLLPAYNVQRRSFSNSRSRPNLSIFAKSEFGNVGQVDWAT